jgi:hypothetical protein
MTKHLLLACALMILALPALAGPREAADGAPPEPVACATAQDLYDLLNAADRHDAKAAARLAAGSCQPLAGLQFGVEDAADGLTIIRIFLKKGEWASSHIAYTLDEMLPTDRATLFCEYRTAATIDPGPC